MSKKALARLENLIGAILWGIGCCIAMIDETFTYRWVIGFLFLILGSAILVLVAKRKENDNY